jgi:hypothetical protein
VPRAGVPFDLPPHKVAVGRFGTGSRPREGKVQTTLGGGYPFRCCFSATGGEDPDDVGWQLPDYEPFTFARRGLKPHLMKDNAPQSGNHHPTAPADPTTPLTPARGGNIVRFSSRKAHKSATSRPGATRRDPGRAAQQPGSATAPRRSPAPRPGAPRSGPQVFLVLAVGPVEDVAEA